MDPALLFVLVEDLDDGADRDGRVVAVEEVEVYVVEPEAGQGVVEVARDIEGGHPLAVLVVVGALADYHDLLAQAAVPYPPAEGPLAVAPAVLVGRIERGAALGEDLIQQREAPLLLPFLFGSDHHGALDDPRYRLLYRQEPVRSSSRDLLAGVPEPPRGSYAVHRPHRRRSSRPAA